MTEVIVSQLSGTEALKVICAWCQRHLSGPPEAACVSHGICAECAERLWLEGHAGGYDLVEAGVQPDQSVWGYWLDLGGEG